MKLLDNASGSYFNVETILVRAMMAERADKVERVSPKWREPLQP